MAKMVKLKSGEEVNVRAQCASPKCGLLLIGNSGDLITSENEKTIRPENVADQADLFGIPQVLCVHC